MQIKDQAIPSAWSSLSLRLSAVFVTILVVAALAAGYLFDRGRSEALKQRELDQLRVLAERGADEVARFVQQLRADVLFLADTPPISEIRRALEAGGLDAVGSFTPGQWQERLQQIFVSFAAARPEYFQLRLIAAQDGGRELVRVERTEDGVRVVLQEALQQKGERYYLREASALPPDAVYLSRIDLNRENGRISVPHRPTLRAATPIMDQSEKPFGVVVVNMDLGYAFEQAQSYRNAMASLYVADEHGDFLLHSDPDHAFAFERGTPFRLEDAFPGHSGRITSVPSDGGALLEVSGAEGGLVAYVTARDLDPRDSRRRLVFMATESVEQLFQPVGLMRSDSLLSVGGLLSLAIVLVVVTVCRLTRSLSTLAKASGAIASGHYQTTLPAADGSEVGRLVAAFQHMAAEVQAREESRDVIEEKRLQARIQAHRIEIAKVGRLALGAEIASSAAHQLSQPLSAISNYAGAIVRLQQQERLGDAELLDILARIEALAQQAGGTLDRLRSLIHRRNQPGIPVDVIQVTDFCLDFLGSRIQQQGVSVERQYGRELPRPMGDPIELGLVLIQLVTNALEAMDGTARGERRLLVSTAHDPEADLVMIEIGDTGPGVSDALAERLFEPWETDKPGALGIGLAVAQTIVEAFGGRIRMMKTAEVGGALFRVELPVVEETH